MPLPSSPVLPECQPAAHVLHAHGHVRMDDGRRKPCSGRFWCTRCRRWRSGPACVLVNPVLLPKGWQ